LDILLAKKFFFSESPVLLPERLPELIICFSYSLHHKLYAVIKPLRKESLAVKLHPSGGDRPVSFSPPV
jgi:hypothetical protein